MNTKDNDLTYLVFEVTHLKQQLTLMSDQLNKALTLLKRMSEPAYVPPKICPVCLGSTVIATEDGNEPCQECG